MAETPHRLWAGARRRNQEPLAAAATRRGCRVNPAWRDAAVEISNKPAVSAVGVTAERDGWGQLIIAVGDIHTAESFPDSLRQRRQCAELSPLARAVGVAARPDGAAPDRRKQQRRRSDSPSLQEAK
jgi:hypothetical protein